MSKKSVTHKLLSFALAIALLFGFVPVMAVGMSTTAYAVGESAAVYTLGTSSTAEGLKQFINSESTLVKTYKVDTTITLDQSLMGTGTIEMGLDKILYIADDGHLILDGVRFSIGKYLYMQNTSGRLVIENGGTVTIKNGSYLTIAFGLLNVQKGATLSIGDGQVAVSNDLGNLTNYGTINMKGDPEKKNSRLSAPLDNMETGVLNADTGSWVTWSKYAGPNEGEINILDGPNMNFHVETPVNTSDPDDYDFINNGTIYADVSENSFYSSVGLQFQNVSVLNNGTMTLGGGKSTYTGTGMSLRKTKFQNEGLIEIQNTGGVGLNLSYECELVNGENGVINIANGEGSIGLGFQEWGSTYTLGNFVNQGVINVDNAYSGDNDESLGLLLTGAGTDNTNGTIINQGTVGFYKSYNKDTGFYGTAIENKNGGKLLYRILIEPYNMENQYEGGFAGYPLDNAVVTVEGREKVTKTSDGTFFYLEPGEYDFSVTLQGYKPYQGKFEVPAALANYDGASTVQIGLETDGNFIDVESVSLYSEPIKIGQKNKISVSVSPQNASVKQVTWTVADPAIASIAADGTVTGLRSGKTKITATIKNGRLDGRDVIGEMELVVLANPVDASTPGAKKLSITTGENGAIACQPGYYMPGDAISMIIQPNTGYVVDKMSATGIAGIEQYFFNNYLIMPDSDTNISVTFKLQDTAKYYLSLRATAGGTVKSTGSSSYLEGETVLITATPYSNYTFDGWTSSGGGTFENAANAVTTFTMPGSNVTLTAHFKYAGGGGYEGSSGSSSSGGGSSSGSGSRDGITTTQSSNAPKDVTTIAASSAAKEAATKAKASGAATATVTIKNPGRTSLAALQAMAKAAGMPVKFNADSMSADGKAVEVRITLDPAAATKDLNLSASTTNAAAKSRKAFFEKWFSNKVSVVSLGQQGTFGQTVDIAAKIDSKMSTESLVFYAYDRTTNTYSMIQNPRHYIDKNEYVHFFTDKGGDIIISDGPLSKK